MTTKRDRSALIAALVGQILGVSPALAEEGAITKTFTLTGNHEGPFNIGAVVQGKSVPVSMQSARDVAPMSATPIPQKPQALFSKSSTCSAPESCPSDKKPPEPSAEPPAEVSTPPEAADDPVLPPPKDWSNNEWYQHLEAGVGIMLGEAPGTVAKVAGTTAGIAAGELVDIYSSLSAVGATAKPALHAWLQKKMREAAEAGDFDRLDRYQAYDTALSTGDNSRLKQYMKGH